MIIISARAAYVESYTTSSLLTYTPPSLTSSLSSTSHRIFVGDQLVFNYSCGQFSQQNKQMLEKNHSISLPLNNWCSTSGVENTPSDLNIVHLIFAHKPPYFNPIDAKLAGIHIAIDFWVRIRWNFFKWTSSSEYMTLKRQLIGKLHRKRIEE